MLEKELCDNVENCKLSLKSEEEMFLSLTADKVEFTYDSMDTDAINFIHKRLLQNSLASCPQATQRRW